MKRTILTAIAILFSITSFAKNQRLSDQELKGKYFKSPDNDKFLGTWFVNNNGVIFSITLTTKKVAIKESFMDFIEGTYTLTENGSVSKSTETSGRQAIRNGVIDKSDPTKKTVKFRIVGLDNKISGLGWLKLLKKNTLSWKIEKDSGQGVIIDGQKMPEINFKIPTSAVLIREK